MATAEKIVHVSEFTNEPFIDFSKPENRTRMQEALKKVKAEFGREYPMWLNGKKVTTTEKRTSTNPSHPMEIIGVFQNATADMARKAVEDAHKYFDTWKKVSPQERAKFLFRAAQIVRERKFELNALVCYEVGKTWTEADADIAETIDFLEYYGREMLRLGEPQKLVPMRGERNYLVYIPLGVGVIIPPWNFPSAIMAGMTAASLVAGNTVVLKPAADSPTIAAKFIDILFEAGIPKEAVNFITGPGSVIGDVLVQHPKTRYIGFTGSKEVGLRISELAGKTVPGQMWIKRTKKITVGPSDDPNNYMGPVVSQSAMKTILDYIEVGKKEGKLLTGGKRAAGDGYFIEPTIIADVDPKARLAQEEVFGPVLAVIKAKNYDQALEIANNTEFGLTGAVYSKNPEKIKRAEETFHVGNLYLNRKCTGAMVGAHPFGGFNMSGTDSKSGGPDYLYLFTQAKSVGEKI